MEDTHGRVRSVHGQLLRCYSQHGIFYRSGIGILCDSLYSLRILNIDQHHHSLPSHGFGRRRQASLDFEC